MEEVSHVEAYSLPCLHDFSAFRHQSGFHPRRVQEAYAEIKQRAFAASACPKSYNGIKNVIELKNVHVKVVDFRLEQINLVVSKGDYCVILGPTGAGKTVLLESIAGLHALRQGAVLLDGKDVTNTVPEERGVSIVYQDYALFPHLTVRENIIFGLRVRHMTKPKIDEALEWICGLFEIQPLLKRLPATLSGGERQRVALSRALITKYHFLW